ncbi:hypothetical protein [Cesiribacter sp. SM1]|uniref:hypothetical protein n=1 Tax=Cesiribacter sp. SM1 TaxID=2861196 RepID=UPI001CD6CBC9|nr:hypothetical protein [Cesiribacter sp. SM1]
MTKDDIKGVVDEIVDTGKGVVGTAMDRFKSPLIGSLLISLIVLLWKPIIFLILSDKRIEDRITYIENRFDYEWYYFLIPVAVTAFYVVGVPFIMWGVGKILNIPKKGVLADEIKFEDDRQELLSKKNTNDTIASLEKELLSSKQEIQKHLGRIDVMQGEIDVLRHEITKHVQVQQVLKDELKNEKNHVQGLKSLIERNVKDDNEVFTQGYGNSRDFELFKTSELFSHFMEVGLSVMKDKRFPDTINVNIKQGFVIAGIVKLVDNHGEVVDFTERGKGFWNAYVGDDFKIKEDDERIHPAKLAHKLNEARDLGVGLNDVMGSLANNPRKKK